MEKLQNPNQLYPMFIASDLARTRDFYVRAGFTVRFDMPEYLHLAYAGDPNLELAFMKPHQATNGRKYESYSGQGVVISIPTDDADEKSKELANQGISSVNPIEDKPWGWRSFHVEDPNGVILDFFHVYKEGPKPNAHPQG
jgi:catechol 2,3-dioxygenase-like lactoylglutathione lyase family enzyme